MNKKVSIGVALTLVLVAIAVTVSVTMIIAMRYFSTMVSDVSEQKAMYDYLNAIDKIVRQNYTAIDEEKLHEALAGGYIDGVNDPYAQFLTNAEYQARQSLEAGNLTGFGLELAADPNENIFVVRVHANSPAAQANIQAGDIVTAMSGEEVTARQLSAVQQTLATQSKVLLTTRRGDASYAMELTASTFVATTVQGRMIDTVGYIEIFSFNQKTAEQFRTVYTDLIGKGATSVIFDVRGNAGGTLSSAADILSYLLPLGTFAKSVGNAGTEELISKGTYEMNVPSVTLVDGRTMGEAELFAAAMRSMSKTVVAGMTTAGKTSVQENFSVTVNNTAVRLTVAQLYLVNDPSLWTTKGLTPDILALMGDETEQYLPTLPDEQDMPLMTALQYLTGASIPDPEPDPGTSTTDPSGTTTGTDNGENTTSGDTTTSTAAA